MAAPLRVEQRLTDLEKRMTALEQLPNRMDRLDARMDGLTVRMDGLTVRMDGLDHRMDRLESEVLQLRTEMHGEFATMRSEIAAVDDRLSVRIEDARRETRVLHEDVIARFALLGEGLAANSRALAGVSGDMRAMFDTVNSRLAAIENRLPVARRRKD